MWGHIAAWKLAGVVIALLPALRSREREREAIPGPVIEMIAEPVEDHDDPPSTVDAETAIDQFFQAWMAEGCGESIAFWRVAQGYAQMAPERGWPPISGKSLSQGLVARGCTRSKRDTRRSGGGRITMIAWPPDYPEDVRRAA